MIKSPVFWRMRNGELIDIDKMDLEHLRNTLKMLVRNNSSVQESRPRSFLNGEMAQFFNDSHFEDECDATEIDIY